MPENEINVNSSAYNFTQEKLAYAKNAITQILYDIGYEGTLEDGTAVYDLLLKPEAYLYSVFTSDLNRAKAYLSLKKANELKAELGDEYDSIIDAILSNWFVERKAGLKSTGIVRCVFSKPLEFLQLTTTNCYFLLDNVKYIVSANQTYYASRFVAIENGAGQSTQYYIDIPVESEESTDVKITVSSSCAAYINSIYLISSSIPAEFSHGGKMESSEDFIKRSQQVITTRELTTHRAIKVVLRNEFSELTDVYVAGFGDYEQIRDIRKFEQITLHVGNHADIYGRVPLSRISQKFTINPYGLIELKDEYGDDLYAADVVRVLYSPGGSHSKQEIPFVINNISETEWASANYPTVIRTLSNEISAGDNVEVEYLTNPQIKQMQAFIDSDEQRNVCYSPIIKSMFPVIISMSLSVTRKEDASLTEEEFITQLKELAAAYTNAIPREENFLISDLIYYLKQGSSDLKQINTPIQVDYKIRQAIKLPGTLGADWVTGSFVDSFTLPSTLSVQMTNNTTLFWTDTSFIDIYISE